MKYILNIDTEKKAISVSLDRPIFLRTSYELPMELERSKRISRKYKNAALPDWLHDEVVNIQRKLEYEITE